MTEPLSRLRERGWGEGKRSPRIYLRDKQGALIPAFSRKREKEPKEIAKTMLKPNAKANPFNS